MGENKEKTKREQLNKIINYFIVKKVNFINIKDLMVQFQDINLIQFKQLFQRMHEMGIISRVKGGYSVIY